LGIIFYGTVTVSAQFFTPILCAGKTDSGAIAITFDDGPLPGKTDTIVSILKSSQVKAAFFCIGKRVDENPALIKLIHQEGHLVSNHSYSHSAAFDLQSAAKMSMELDLAGDAIQHILGMRPRFFRPPYGVTNPSLAKAIRKGNYLTVGWTVRSFDTMINDKVKLLRRVTCKLKAGDIVLFHDYCDVTIEILPDFLEYVKNVGLKIVRVDELLNEKPYVSQS
jgi:peptidoglycan/xylan/chitin deacetylase (PgdA/CDA1 family)